jgi:hypothetical protein
MDSASLNGAFDNMFDDECVAADVPSRLETNAGMGETDRASSRQIRLVKHSSADGAPMTDLGVLRPIHVRIV